MQLGLQNCVVDRTKDGTVCFSLVAQVNRVVRPGVGARLCGDDTQSQSCLVVKSFRGSSVLLRSTLSLTYLRLMKSLPVDHQA